MRNISGMPLCAAGLVLLAGQASGQTYSWTGNVSPDWRWASNWDPQAIPGIGTATGAIAFIGQGPGIVRMGNGPEPIVLASLGAYRRVRIESPLQTGGLAVLTDVDYQHNYFGEWTNGGTIRFTGENSLWSAGVIVGGEVINEGTMVLGAIPVGSSRLDGATFRNRGIANLYSGLVLLGGAEFINETTMNCQASSAVTLGVGGGTLRNEGTLNLSGGSINSGFVNLATMNVAGSAVINSPAAETRGTVSLNNGNLTVWGVSSMPKFACAIEGVGKVRLAGTQHWISGATTTSIVNIPASGEGFWIDMDSGVLHLTGNLTNHGLMTWSRGRLAGTPIVSGYLHNFGRLYWGTGGSTAAILDGDMYTEGRIVVRGAPRISEHGRLTVLGKGILDLTEGSISPGENFVPGVIRSEGTVLRSAAAQSPTQVGVYLEHYDGARIRVEKSMLSLTKGGNWLGESSVTVGTDPNAVLRISDLSVAISGGRHGLFGEGEVRLETGGGFVIYAGRLTNHLGEHGTGKLVINGSGYVHDLEWPASFVNYGRVEVFGRLHSTHNEGVIQAGGTLLGAIYNGGSMGRPGTLLILGSAALEHDHPFGPSGFIINFTGSQVVFDGFGYLELRGTRLSNDYGVVRKIGPGSGTIGGNGTVDNRNLMEAVQGILSIAATCAIEQVENLNGTNILVGGRWVAHPGATLLLNRPIGAIFSPTEVRGDTTSLPWLAGALDVRGKTEITGNSSMSGAVSVRGDEGVLSIESPAQMTVPGSVQNGVPLEDPLSEIEQVFVGGRTSPPRLITPVLNNHARLVPGGHELAGPFNLTGHLVLHPTSRVLVELGGLVAVQEYDQLAITGSASLGGELHLALLDEFVPAAGQAFTVLTASGSISGEFSAVVPPSGLPAGMQVQVSYTSGSVVVQFGAGCYPNCDGSTIAPILNVADFSCFLGKFASGDPYANCDGSTIAPVLNIQDFSCFLGKFAAGCP